MTKTLNIKNIDPFFIIQEHVKNSLFILAKHNKKEYLIEFSKSDLINYFKNHDPLYDNLFFFLKYEILEKK